MPMSILIPVFAGAIVDADVSMHWVDDVLQKEDKVSPKTFVKQIRLRCDVDNTTIVLTTRMRIEV
jgi:hypothetical protein